LPHRLLTALRLNNPSIRVWAVVAAAVAGAVAGVCVGRWIYALNRVVAVVGFSVVELFIF
jgi:hypothetical protein